MFGFRGYIRLPPRLISSPQSRQQSLGLGINPADHAVQRFPHDNFAGIHLCDECMKSILPIVCRMPESIFVTALASLLTDQRISGLPMRARYKHFTTICEHTFLTILPLMQVLLV